MSFPTIYVIDFVEGLLVVSGIAVDDSSPKLAVGDSASRSSRHAGVIVPNSLRMSFSKEFQDTVSP